MPDILKIEESTLVSEPKIESKDWYAWNNLMPPKPDDFHVVGQVKVSNPGIVCEMRYKEPQGINPDIVLLELILIQRPGYWPQVTTWADAKYDKVMKTAHYTNAEILYEDSSIASLVVHDVH